jgi:hypothetical protein
VAARLLLVGGGHAHVEVLRVFAATPEPGLDITLISPGATLLYSGMVPGVIAGHYALADAGIALAPLVAAARGRFVDERAVALDLDRRRVALRGGGSLAFDWLSLDIGSTPDRSIPGAHAHAIAARPLSALVDAWAATQAKRQRIDQQPPAAGAAELTSAVAIARHDEQQPDIAERHRDNDPALQHLPTPPDPRGAAAAQGSAQQTTLSIGSGGFEFINFSNALRATCSGEGAPLAKVKVRKRKRPLKCIGRCSGRSKQC